MNEKEMLAELQVKDFDLDKFVSLVLANKETRDFMINNLLERYIMIYYHAYYVIDAASKKKPKLFYEYWDRLETFSLF